MHHHHLGNREGWLTALAAELEPVIKVRTSLPIRPYRIACGWPSRRGTTTNRRAVGECWPVMDKQGVAELFISPVLDDIPEIAHVVGHEMLHACLPREVGHRKQFSQAAKALGLIGKPTETEAGEELRILLGRITLPLGSYPHERIRVNRPGEPSRNLKFMCPECGYIGRTSAHWLDTVGAPICRQCAKPMVATDCEPASPLEVTSQTVEFRIPGDDRFTIRSVRGANREVQWFVLDFGTVLLTDAPPRMGVRNSRQGALDLIDDLRTGRTTWRQVHFNDRFLLASHNPFLADDEDEQADYPEDQTGDESFAPPPRTNP